MSDLPGWFAQFPFLTPAAMLAGIYWMLATDRIVTGASHRRELAEKDERIAERDKVIAKQDKTIEVLTDQNERLSVVGEAFLKIMDAIDKISHKRGTP